MSIAGKGLVFDKVYKVILGGRVDAKGVQSEHFFGIIGGTVTILNLYIKGSEHSQKHPSL